MATYDANKANDLLRKHAEGLGDNARPVRKYDRPLWKEPEQRFKQPEDYDGWKQQKDADYQVFMDNWRQNQFSMQNRGQRIAGPQGEQLPPGAVAWDYNGQPYYGEGFQGWLNGFVNRLRPTYNYEEPTGGLVAQKPLLSQGGLSFGQTGLDIGQTIKNLWANAKAQETPIGLAARGVQVGASELIKGANVPAVASEQLLGTAQNLRDVSNISAAQQGKQLLVGMRPIRTNDPEYQKWRDYFLNMAPPQESYEQPDWGKAAKEGWQAGRVFYSTIIDPLVKQEFLRRYQAGENPMFLQQELENPGAELVGQLLIDPSYLIGFGGKAAKAERTLTQVQKKFLDVVPEVDEVLRAADTLSEAGSVETFQKAVQAQKAATTRISRGLTALADDYRFTARTSNAKQFNIGNEVSEMLNWLTHNHTPEESLDAMEAMVKLASDSEDEIGVGLSYLRSGKAVVPHALASEAGVETGLVLRRIMGLDEEADTAKAVTKFFDEIKKAAAGDSDELVKLAHAKTEKALAGMFPSVGEMKTAAQKVKGGRATTDAEKALAARYAQLPNHVKVLADVGEKMTKAYKVPNSFFAAIYMGLSPGYAFRNFTQNSLQIAIDHGAGALFKTHGAALRDTEALLGGVVPTAAHGFGKGISGMEAVSEGVSKSKLLFARDWAEGFESWGAAQTTYASVKRTLDAMWRPGRALPDLKPLVEAGLPRQVAQRMADLVWEYKGDVGKAVDTILGQVKTGEVDLYRGLGWVTKEDRKALLAFGKDDEILDILKTAESPDDAVRRLDEIRDAMRADAANIANDMPGVAEDAIGAADAFMAGAEFTDDEKKLIYNFYQANGNAIKNTRNAVYDLINQYVPELRPLYNQTDEAANKILGDAEAFGDRWSEWKRHVINAQGREPQNLTKLWRETGMTTAAPTEWKEFLKRFHNEFFVPKRNEYHVQIRGMWEEALNSIKSRIGGENPMIKSAEYDLRLAQQYDDVVVNFPKTEFALRDAIANKDARSAVNILANRYGVPTAVAKGEEVIPLDKRLLNTVNKYLPEPKKSWSGLQPLSDPDEALVRRKALGFTEHDGINSKKASEFLQENIPGSEVEFGTHHIDSVSKQEVRGLIIKRGDAKILVSVQETPSGIIMGFIESNKPGSGLGSDVMEALRQYSNLKAKEFEVFKVTNPKFYDRFDWLNKTSSGYVYDPFKVAKKKFGSLNDITIDDIPAIQDAFARRLQTKAAEGVETAAQVAPDVAKLEVPYAPGSMPSTARALHESAAGLDDLFERLKAGVNDNWGKTAPTIGNPQIEKAIEEWVNGTVKDGKKIKGALEGVAESRLLAANVADADRAFTLLSYPDKTYADLALSFIFPYQYWYSRTYSHWIQRIATDPQVIAAYAKYREYMEKIHAGAPDWWKYQINSDEVFGVQTDNPLFFNLEAALNPLNGITGVDFNDPYRRVNWWTKTLDDLNKLGPSTFTPFSMAAALLLKAQNEEDAAARWGGRLAPQTAAVKSLLAKFNIFNKTGEGFNEYDPFVQFFSNGIDPYERNRAGRALGWMVEQGEISAAEAQDAARTQSGQIWDEAVKRSIQSRMNSQLTSFFLGVGYKGRNRSDMQIDQMYHEYQTLMNLNPIGQDGLFDPREFQRKMDELRNKYPFMEAVLLSRKGGDERDRSYAYSVMSRIPPGQKDDIAEVAGIDARLFDKFYENKGDMTAWSQQDRERFMAGIVDIGAVLDLPDEATKAEWNLAKDRYSDMQDAMKQLFGDDILERIDGYYAAKGEGIQRLKADTILQNDPGIEAALTWRDQQIMASPFLRPYYATIDKIERYYNGAVYSMAEDKFGADIFDIQDGYYTAKLEGTKAAKAYLKENPQLIEYWDWKALTKPLFSDALVRVAKMLQDPTYPELRTDQGTSIGQEDLINYFEDMQQPTVYDYTWDDWRAQMSEPLERLVEDYAYSGRPLNSAARDQIEYMAGQYDLDAETLTTLLREAALER